MDLERRCVHNVSHHEMCMWGGEVCWEWGRGGNKGIWLQNWVTVCNTWLPVVKDEQQRGKGWANKDPLEGSLILVGRLTGRSAWSAPSQLELGSLCQDNCLLHFSLWTELQVPSDRQHPCISPPTGCLSTVNDRTYHFRQARSTKGSASYWYVRGCVVCAWDHFPSLWWQSLSADEAKFPLTARGIKQICVNKKWNTWKLVIAI